MQGKVRYEALLERVVQLARERRRTRQRMQMLDGALCLQKTSGKEVGVSQVAAAQQALPFLREQHHSQKCCLQVPSVRKRQVRVFGSSLF